MPHKKKIRAFDHVVWDGTNKEEMLRFLEVHRITERSCKKRGLSWFEINEDGTFMQFRSIPTDCIGEWKVEKNDYKIKNIVLLIDKTIKGYLRRGCLAYMVTDICSFKKHWQVKKNQGSMYYKQKRKVDHVIWNGQNVEEVNVFLGKISKKYGREKDLYIDKDGMLFSEGFVLPEDFGDIIPTSHKVASTKKLVTSSVFLWDVGFFYTSLPHFREFWK